MNSNYNKIFNQVKNWMNDNPYPDQQQLISLISAYESIPGNQKLNDIEKNNMIKKFEHMFAITIESGTQLTKQGWQPWLHTRNEDQKKEFYADRYKNYLLNNTDMPNSVINEIFNSTDKILECMANPLQSVGFKKKGLVVGHVQSGKTANYLALLNKAADIGYKLIILIAGVHNNLRTQTQKRVNDGFIGFDSLKRDIVGVGIGLDGNINKRPISLTNTESDFKKSFLNQQTFDPTNSTVPVIMVVKKNSATLKNILSWLETSKDKDTIIKNYPMLLIDDEADNASINTKKKPNEATTINRQIRQILNMFYKVCYIGFTATPFANIFIDPDVEHEEYKDDLFPDDFIISLETPSNYMGAKKIFIDENEKYIREIDDNESYFPVPLPNDFKIDDMPKSFYDAIYLFILSIGIKKIRGIKNPHTSMLVNVIHKNKYQEDVKIIVDNEIKVLLNLIKFNYKKSINDVLKNEKLKNIYDIWQIEYNSTGNFMDILSEVIKLELQIKALLINSKSKDQLNYDDYKDDGGLHVIAIGGYSLSRGFTLEGLTVSYFLRNTAMYDTLLQMGRWFGYRDGYEDICRIYLTRESKNWYSHIAQVLEELREEFKVLEYHKLTPRDYGLKVQTHPEKLLITALNKMYNAEEFILSTSYSSTLFEVKALFIENSTLKNNEQVLLELFNKLEYPYISKDEKENKNGYLWNNIDVSVVIDFVKKYKVYISEKNEIDSLLEYIEMGSNKELKNWDIYFAYNGNSKLTNKFKYEVKMQKRTLKSYFKNYISFKDGGGRIVRFFDEKIGLSDDQIKSADKILIEKGIKQSGEPYRQVRTKPLLVIKILDVCSKEESISQNIVAYGISFPKCSENNRSVKFKVNKIWKEHNLNNSEETDEERDDD